jgi:SAM-dependent methyltransferase
MSTVESSAAPTVAPGNVGQASAWAGAEGQHWSAHAERYDTASRRYDPHLITAARLTAASTVLDIGCGAGVSSRDAAVVAVEGHVLGVDLSPQLVEQARRRAVAAGLRNVDFECADAQAHRFPRGAFDVAISRFGAMFFADPSAAFRNIARGLRPGGRFALLAWRSPAHNEWVSVIRSALAAGRTLPEPPAAVPGPFGLADPVDVNLWLHAAGYTGIELIPLAEPITLGSDVEDAFAYVCGLGLARGLLAGLDESEAGRALVGLRDRLSTYLTPDGVLLGSAAWLITGRLPGQ